MAIIKNNKNNKNNNCGERIVHTVRTPQSIINEVNRRNRVIRYLRNSILLDPLLPASPQNMCSIETLFEKSVPIQVIITYLNCYYVMIQTSNPNTIYGILDNDAFENFIYDDDNHNPNEIISHMRTYFCIMAAAYDRIDVLEFALKHNFDIYDEEIIYRACANLFLNVVEWCIRNGCPFNFEKCMKVVEEHPCCDDACEGHEHMSVGSRIEELLKSI